MKLQGHGFNVLERLEFIGRPLGGVFYGVELELDFTKTRKCNCGDPECETTSPDRKEFDSTTDKIIKLLGDDYVVLKRDGTVPNGLEIVTAPAGISIHREKWKRFFAELPKYLEATDKCGMHVHVSKKPLKPSEQSFIHEAINLPKTKKWVQEIAGRKENQYTKYINKPKEKIDLSCTAWEDFPVGKYEAVNFLPQFTLEVRIFASTTSYETFMERLEFVGALVNMAQKSPPTNLYEWPKALEEFVVWRDGGKIYPFLKAWMEKNDPK